MWLFKYEFLENVESHISQEYGFSPVCILMCLFRSEFTAKAEPHTSQEYGFSPECVPREPLQI